MECRREVSLRRLPRILALISNTRTSSNLRFAKRFLIVAGAGALAGILAIAIAPKTAHGLVAALVQVSNTPAAPAITLDVSRLASQNVQLVCVGTQNCSHILPDGSSPVPTYIVPAGSSLVITAVQINTASSGSVQMNQASGSGESTRASWTFAAGGRFEFQYPSGIVFSTGSDLSISSVTPPFEEAFLTGYLVNAQ